MVHFPAPVLGVSGPPDPPLTFPANLISILGEFRAAVSGRSRSGNGSCESAVWVCGVGTICIASGTERKLTDHMESWTERVHPLSAPSFDGSV